MTGFQCGDVVDITIKGVRVVNHPSARLVRIADEHGDTFDMPAQAAITRPGGDSIDDRIAAVLALLDSMEDEGTTRPYISAAVRKTLGLPPRHWPPQPGDVWDDGFPFGGSLWFARQYKADDENPDWPSRIVMTCVAGGRSIQSPQDLLESACELKLAYRAREGGVW